MSDPAVQIVFGGNSAEALHTVQKLDKEMIEFARHAKEAAVAVLLLDKGLNGLKNSPMALLLSHTQQFTKAVQGNAVTAVGQLNTALAKAATTQHSMATAPTFGGGSRSGRGGSGGSGGVGDMLKGSIVQTAGAVGLTGGIAGAVLATRSLVTATMDYKQALAGAAAVGGFDVGSDDYNQIAAAARKAGAETRFSATESALALRELVAAGYSTKQSITGLADVLDLATAGEMGMQDASSYLVSVLNMFNMPVTEAGRLVDVLATGANASTASIKSLAEGMVFVGPNARALGISLEDTTAMMSTLANAGVQAGMAGRGLSAVFSKTLNPSTAGDLVEELAKVGLNLDDINPSLVGVKNAMTALASLKPKTLSQLFGVENFDVANVLTQVDKLTEMQGKFVNTKGAGHRFALTMADTSKGDVKELQSAFEELQLQIGDMIDEPMREWLQDLTEYLRDNTGAIIGVVQAGVGLAQSLEHLIKLYVGFKAVQFGFSAAGWIAMNGAIIKNTALLMTNSLARQNAMMQMTAGMGATMSHVLSSSLSSAFSGGGVIGAVKSSAASLGLVFGVGVAAWELGSALEKALDISGRVDKMLNEATDAVQKKGAVSIEGVHAEIANAKSPQEVEAAKQKALAMAKVMRDEISRLQKDASFWELSSGSAQTQIDTLSLDAAILEKKAQQATVINQQVTATKALQAAEEKRRAAIITPEMALANQKDTDTKSKEVQDYMAAQEAMMDRRNQLQAEYQIAMEKSAGHTKEADRLQLELDLLNEKKRVAEILGKAEYDPEVERIARGFIEAKRKKDTKVEPSFVEVVSDTRRSGGGGGYFFAGGGEADPALAFQKKQADLLDQAVKELKKLNEKGGKPIRASATTN